VETVELRICAEDTFKEQEMHKKILSATQTLKQSYFQQRAQQAKQLLNFLVNNRLTINN
jgi:hypothetical protein